MIITEDSKDVKSQPLETLGQASSSTQSEAAAQVPLAPPEKGGPSPSAIPDDQLPPPYERTVASPSSSAPEQDPEAARYPRVNYLYLSEITHDIKGCWRIDPNLRIPQSLLPTVPDGQKRDNLHLMSRTGSIQATCRLTPSESAVIKSSLFAETQTGKVKIQIPARKNHRFHLWARSTTGNVTVLIPRDFHGPVSFTLQTGKMTFSPAVHSIFMPLNHVGKTGRGFIGNWDDSAYPDVVDSASDSKTTWPGDELVLATQTGNIKIFYEDEPLPPSEKDLLLNDLRQHGPIAALGMSVKRGLTKAMGGGGAGPSSSSNTYKI